MTRAFLLSFQWDTRRATICYEADPPLDEAHTNDLEQPSTSTTNPPRSSRDHRRHQGHMARVKRLRAAQIEAETPQAHSSSKAPSEIVQNMPAQFPPSQPKPKHRRARKAHYTGSTAKSDQEHSIELEEFLLACGGSNPFLRLLQDSIAGPGQLGVTPKEGITIPPRTTIAFYGGELIIAPIN